MRWFCYSMPLVLFVAIDVLPAHAQLTPPLVGWQAEFDQPSSHNVSGTVSIFDEDTLQFDDFTYDGGGIVVYFYLGTANDNPAFTSGLQIGAQLVGSVFDGTQDSFLVDLPPSQTIDGWNAISVWCVTASASFGSGSFMAVDGQSADFDTDGDVDGADFLKWQRGESPNPLSALDLADWEANYGAGAPLSLTAIPVPEPSTWIALLLAMMAVLFRGDVLTRGLACEKNSADVKS